MKQSIIMLSFTAILATFVKVCSAEQIDPVSSSDAAMAYGNISLSEGNITNVILFRVGEGGAPPIDVPNQSHVYDNGDYFFENLEPGTYFIMGFTAGNKKFNFNYRGTEEAKFINGDAVEVKRGSVTYLGSYNVKGIDQDSQNSEPFEIARNKTAVKILILKHLKAEAQGTGWDQRMDRAMK
jgi:hypothetical protein